MKDLIPVLFTPNGLIYLQRKIVKKNSHDIEYEKTKNEDQENYRAIDKVISMQWVGANPNPEIIAEELSTYYHSYGILQEKARVFNKLTYKEIYPGIDITYSVKPESQKGFEYSIIAKPGADLSRIKMRYGEEERNIKQLLQNTQRILQPVSVINPYAEQLKIPN